MVEQSLYNGRVKVRFYEDVHRYYVSVDSGPFKQKKGVTTIIKIKDKSEALAHWYQQITADFLLDLVERGVPIDYNLALEAAIQNETLKVAGQDIGTKAHGWMESYIKNMIKVPGYESVPPMPDGQEVNTAILSMLDWFERDKVMPIESEKVVYSLKHDYIGTLDLDASVLSRRSLIDFKTSNGLYNDVLMQTGGYQGAAEEEIGKKVYKERYAVRFSKYTEEEYMIREARKRQIRQSIAKVRGITFNDYQIFPYQAFEVKKLNDISSYQKDIAAFKHCLSLSQWNYETDFFKNRLVQK